MDAFEFLGVAQDADERVIKRAYARRLKLTRPDDDPLAFQQLHAAYQDALWWARREASAIAAGDVQVFQPDLMEADCDVAAAGPPLAAACTPLTDVAHAPPVAEDASVEVTAPIDALRVDHGLAHGRIPTEASPTAVGASSATEVPAFDEAAFVDTLLAQAGSLHNTVFARWLAEAPELYDLARKNRITHDLLWRLQHDPHLLPREAGNALDEFLGVDLDGVRARATVLRALETEDTYEFEQFDPSIVRQLKRPFSTWQATLAQVWTPGLATGVVELENRMVQLYRDPLPGVDPRQPAFFRRMLDTTDLGRDRWRLMLTRAFVYGFGISVPILLLIALFLANEGGVSPWTGLAWSSGTVAALAAFGTARLLFSAGRVRLARYVAHGGRDPLPPATVTLIATTCLLALTPEAFRTFAWGTALLAMLCAMRHLHRILEALRFAFGGAWILLASTSGAIPADAAAVTGIAAGAAVMLAADCLHARRSGARICDHVSNRITFWMSYVVLAAGIIAGVAGAP